MIVIGRKISVHSPPLSKQYDKNPTGFERVASKTFGAATKILIAWYKASIISVNGIAAKIALAIQNLLCEKLNANSSQRQGTVLPAKLCKNLSI